MRTVGVSFILLIVFSGIAGIFWYQEMQYLLPTPVPTDYKVVLPDELIEFDRTLIAQNHSRPKLLHFFGPACPCSKFNLRHFLSLSRQYNNKIDFYVVVIDQSKVESTKKMIDKSITIVVDKREQLAQACGIYA